RGRRRYRNSGRGRHCNRGRGRGCRGWRRTPQNLHRVIGRGGRVTASQPDSSAAIGVSREVAPRRDERQSERPTVGDRVVHVHFIGWVGGSSAAAHHKHFTAYIQGACFRCGARNVRDGRHGVV